MSSFLPRPAFLLRMLGFVLGVVFLPGVRAQDWFTQRTIEDRSAPLKTGIHDKFAGPPAGEAPGDDTGRRRAFATTTPAVGTVYSATGVPVAIGDFPAAATTSTINVPAITGLTGIKVSLSIQHSYRGDLRVTLRAPNNTVFTLSDQQGGGADNIVITDQALSLPGNFNAQGAWVLSAVDLASGDSGQLQSWSLTVQTAGSGALIDLVVALESNPTGDNDGSHQGQAGSEQQDKWERIMQHFADAVYEMSEGRHKIRQIRIFRNGQNFGAADVRWAALGHPHVPGNGGIGVPGGHINMYEVFKDGAGTGVNYDMLADEKGAGYTQAHEWGHYFYGVYDEYFIRSGDVAVSPSVMSSQWNATGGDYRWLNFSIKRQSGGDYQNTLLNWQHRAYGASAWEVLGRPVASDPTDVTSKSFQSLGPRIYYPEVAGAAPTGANTPAINLPSAQARSALDIIWMQSRVTMEIVIDNSGSMSGTAMEQAKTAAKLLVDQVTLGQARVGVTVFNSTVTSIVALTDVNTEGNRTTIKNAINAVSAGGNTAIGDAADSALTKILAGSAATETRVVFLLSDGQSNTGRDPLSVIPAYTTAKVPLFTFAFGDSADTATLNQMATGTGGRFFVSPTTLAQISAAFLAASQTAQSTPGLGAGSLQPTSGNAATLSVPVDTTLARMLVTVVYSGSAPASTVTLVRPGGGSVSPTQTTVVGNETLLFFDVASPTAGAWTLRTDASAAGTTFSYTVSGTNNGVGLNVNAGLRDGGTSVTQPGSVVIESRLTRRQAVTGATAECAITRPNGTTLTIALKDDGVAPDLVANDGNYTGSFTPSARGAYTATVRFTNPGLTARETYVGAVGSSGVNGQEVALPADTPIGENFARSQTLQISVEVDQTVVPPSFTSHPGDRSIVVGGSGTFTAAATGVPTPTLQWQRQAGGAGAWSNVADGGSYSGGTTGTLTVSNVSVGMNGDKFRCLATNGALPDATSNPATLTVGDGSQTISFATIPNKTYGDVPFAPSVSASSGLTVALTIVSGPATAAGPTITITGVGTVTVRATQPGNLNYSAATPVERTFTVAKAPLTVIADDKSKAIGAAVPALTMSFVGFVNGETSAVIDLLPVLATAAATNSPSGAYPITLTGGSDDNYALSLVNGTLSVSTTANGPVIQNTPASAAVTLGQPVVLAVKATSPVPLSYAWQRNGAAVTGGTASTLILSSVQLAQVGLYGVSVNDGSVVVYPPPAIVGVTSTAKVIGSGQELSPVDIRHPNGNIFDQVLLTGAVETITADAGQVTRTSFIDMNNDIVQVEFSGPGALTVVLDGQTGPNPPVNYNQAVSYMKGHAGIVITGATENTNVSVFSVGRLTAFDPSGGFNILLPPGPSNNPANNGSTLFQGHGGTAYDGFADIAFIAILSTNGKFGGVRTANASYFARKGYTGLYAPGVQFTGPVYLGDVNAFDDARPVLMIGSSLGNTWITGGDLAQSNGRNVQVSGLTALAFKAGIDSHGNAIAAKRNQALLEQDGLDVTSQVVVNP